MLPCVCSEVACCALDSLCFALNEAFGGKFHFLILEEEALHFCMVYFKRREGLGGTKGSIDAEICVVLPLFSTAPQLKSIGRYRTQDFT